MRDSLILNKNVILEENIFIFIFLNKARFKKKKIVWGQLSHAGLPQSGNAEVFPLFFFSFFFPEIAVLEHMQYVHCLIKVRNQQ